jgi:hypothetical protein
MKVWSRRTIPLPLPITSFDSVKRWLKHLRNDNRTLNLSAFFPDIDNIQSSTASSK